jgi:hypothetical protein
VAIPSLRRRLLFNQPAAANGVNDVAFTTNFQQRVGWDKVAGTTLIGLRILININKVDMQDNFLHCIPP